MKVQQLIDILEGLAPLSHAEDFDNTGLLVGNPATEVTGVLVTLDCTEAVVQEALEIGANVIVSFHPIIFKGLTHITGDDYVQRVVIQAIKADIAIFSMHTALDNSSRGVNARIMEVLGIETYRALIPRREQLLKLVTYVPLEAIDDVRAAVFQAGAGEIGEYSECSFELRGEGGFLPLQNAQPAKGNRGERYRGDEIQFHAVLDRSREKPVIQALKSAHPYEEVAYEIYTLRNERPDLGMGMAGEFKEEMEEIDFLHLLRDTFGTPVLRHSALTHRKIKKIGVLGGSGAFAIESAIRSGCQAFVTADLKYHQFFQPEARLLLVDIGHFESEQFTKNLLYEFLTEKIPNFAVTLSKTRTNPVFYF